MAEKIAQLAASEGMRQEFGKLSREIVLRDLNLERCADRHLSAYKIISGKGRLSERHEG